MPATKSECPTIPPGFDVARYARDSDERMARVEPPPTDDDDGPPTKRSEVRLLTRPEMGSVVTDEGWARTMTGSPVCTMDPATLKRLPLDHRAGFLLSLMDGRTELETLLELACMPREEVLRVVRDLYESGVVEFC
jgi:hypothetical protein